MQYGLALLPIQYWIKNKRTLGWLIQQRGQAVSLLYLRRSVGLGAVAPGRQGAALSQALGWVADHGLLLFLVGGIVVIVATVPLVVHHLTLAVGHVGEGRVLHGRGVGKSPTVKRGLRLGEIFRANFKSSKPCFFGFMSEGWLARDKYLFSILLVAGKRALMRKWLLLESPTSNMWMDITRDITGEINCRGRTVCFTGQTLTHLTLDNMMCGAITTPHFLLYVFV